jgi:hypothetical protein
MDSGAVESPGRVRRPCSTPEGDRRRRAGEERWRPPLTSAVNSSRRRVIRTPAGLMNGHSGFRDNAGSRPPEAARRSPAAMDA